METKHFTQKDFEGCIPPASHEDMKDSFMRKLEKARSFSNVPFLLSSSYRSPEWELKNGRKGTSSHCKGLAVDIRVMSSAERKEILSALILAGFRRIGIAKTYVHVDDDPDKPMCVWLY